MAIMVDYDSLRHVSIYVAVTSDSEVKGAFLACQEASVPHCYIPFR